MIEATIIFKDGLQTHLTINVSFEDKEDEIETDCKIGFIEFNTLDEKIPSYMHILGRLLKERAKSFWDDDSLEDEEKASKEKENEED